MSQAEFITQEQLANVRLPAEEAYNLPRAAYTSQRIFDLEAKHVFKANWINVAHVSQIPNPGDYLCVDILDYPMVVTRDIKSNIHVMSRVCQHKGTLIAEGKGNTRLFICPFHAWSYALDGQLKAAPMMDKAKGFDRKNCHLTQVRTEIWEGFIFINISADKEPLEPRLGAPPANRSPG